MKAFLAIIIVAIAALVGLGTYMALGGDEDLYEIANVISYNQVKEDSEGINYYYYYQDTCTHCIELKPFMYDVYNYSEENSDDFDLYFIDSELSENSPSWSSDENFSSLDNNSKIEYLNTQDYYLISGTPTLVEEQDGQVIGYYVGTDQITNVFNSKYGIVRSE